MSAASVSGTYDITVKSPMGDQKGRLTVDADGTSFTGDVSIDMMGAMEITEGSVDDNRLIWSMTMHAPMQVTLDCDAAVDGDTIAGSVKAGAFGTFKLSGTRAG